ncbi:MAG: hypothetical protein GEV10_03290 [Streptosporangiales bacterium]|nr:hypothetical protein [Streptosporangiales bacterium]
MAALLPAASALAVATAALLTWTGVVKLLAPGEGALTGLRAVLGRPALTRGVVRAAGVAELAVAAALLAAPAPVAGIASAVLGLAFLGYLARLRHVAPGASCGCTGAAAPVTWRSFARAGLVAASGVLVAVAGTPWWRAALDRPGVVALALTAVLAAYVATSPEADGRWLLPLRRLRVRILGHPLREAGSGSSGSGPVPVAASVDLLESSLAWQSAAHLVRSSLREHWVVDDWRVLRYAGRHETAGESRPVSVLFAVDARASTCAPHGTAVRVTVVDDETERVLGEEPLRVPRIRPLPVA